MSTVPVSSLDKNTHAKLVCTYAALVLHDDGLDITDKQLNKLVAASGNTIDGFWTKMFASTLSRQDVASLLQPTGGASTGGAAATNGAAPAGGAPAKQEVKEEPKKEAAPEEDMDMGDLFG